MLRYLLSKFYLARPFGVALGLIGRSTENTGGHNTIALNTQMIPTIVFYSIRSDPLSP